MGNKRRIQLSISAAIGGVSLAICIGYIIMMSSVKVGEAKIIFKSDTNEVIIDRFPNYSIGFDGDYHWSDLDFPFGEVDRAIYRRINRRIKYYSADTVVVKIVNYHINEYGEEYANAPIAIGIIDVNNSKVYENFSYWCRKYSIKKMYLNYHEQRCDYVTQYPDSCRYLLYDFEAFDIELYAEWYFNEVYDGITHGCFGKVAGHIYNIELFLETLSEHEMNVFYDTVDRLANEHPYKSEVIDEYYRQHRDAIPK